MTYSPIKFIKSLEKLTDGLWLYTPGEYTNNDGDVSRYKLWIKRHPGGGRCVVYTHYPTDLEMNVSIDNKTDYHTIFDACTYILRWFMNMTDYENDPARLAELDDCYAKGIGPIPEFVIHPKYTDVLRAAEMQLKEPESASNLSMSP